MLQIWKKFYLSPRFVVQELKRTVTPHMLAKKAEVFFKLLFANSFKRDMKMKQAAALRENPSVIKQEEELERKIGRLKKKMSPPDDLASQAV